MDVKIWGSRGSVPVSGPEYVRHGGDTTCVELRAADGGLVILDAGTGIRPLGNVLLKEGPRDLHLFLSHAHWDHVMGFPFFRPLYKKGYRLHIQGCTAATDSIRWFFEETMRPPFFPVSLADVSAELAFSPVCTQEYEVGSLRVSSFPLSHPNGGFGFRIAEGPKSLCFFPDNELTFDHPGGRSFDDLAGFVSGADVLLHDAEYRPEEYAKFSRSWGHSVFFDTVRLAAKAGVRRLLLWHLNQDRTDAEVDAMVEEARRAAREAAPGLVVEAASRGLSFGL